MTMPLDIENARDALGGCIYPDAYEGWCWRYAVPLIAEVERLSTLATLAESYMRASSYAEAETLYEQLRQIVYAEESADVTT